MKELVRTFALAASLFAPLLVAQEPKPVPGKPTVKERLDRNDDGKVGPRERAAAKGLHDGWMAEWKSFAARNPEASRRMLAKADTDGDGELSPAERKAAHEAMTQWRREHVQDDWQQFVAEHPEAAKKMKAEIDKNGDGKIDEVERKLAHERMATFRAERREQRPDGKESKATPRADRDHGGEVDRVEREKGPRGASRGQGAPAGTARRLSPSAPGWVSGRRATSRRW
ncbi:MAG: hypothetical protein WAT39_05925 [Planctomycetota bacterium]